MSPDAEMGKAYMLPGSLPLLTKVTKRAVEEGLKVTSVWNSASALLFVEVKGSNNLPEQQLLIRYL